jgi:hypothetical protein
MEKRASLISSEEKGRIKEAAWEELSEVEETSGARFKMSAAGRGVPRSCLKKE